PFATFLDQFQSFLAVAATTPHDFIITGDFNIHVNKSDSRSTQFLDILHSHNLDQLVSSPTHKHGDTLDLVITTSDSPLSATVSVYPTRPADHFPVLSRLEVPSRTPPPIINRTFRRIHSIDVDRFMSDLLSEPLITQPPSRLSDLIGLYNSTLFSLLDKHAPLITKPISSRPSNPWFTSYAYMNSKSHDVAWKRHGNARVTHTMPCAFDSSPISITTPSSKLKKSIMLPLSQLISFSPKGSGNGQYHSTSQTFKCASFFFTCILSRG